jgi:diguanylate cyclase (GGDEF)-like protein/PAS domain S-box-containing protein
LRAGGGVVLLLWLCLAAWIYADLHNSLERERRSAGRVAGTLSKVLEGHLQATVQKIDLRLSEFAESHRRDVTRREPRSSVEPALARHLALVPEALSFRIADAEGRYIYDASGELSAATIGDRPYFLKLRDDPSAGLVVSEPLKSRVSGDWVFVLARRLDDDAGRFAGIVLAAIRTDFLERFYSTLDVGRHGTVTLWSGNMEMVARWPVRPDWRGRKLVGSPITQRLAAGETVGTFTRAALVDGEERLFVFRKTEGLPFVFSVGLAEREFLAEWRHRAIVYALLGTILALALAALLWAWTRSYARATEMAEDMAAAFRSKEREGRALLDAIPEPAWLIDTEGNILAINEAFCRRIGRPMDDLIGKSTASLFPAEIAAKLREAQLRVYRENAPVREEFCFDTGNGPQPFEFLRVPVYDEAGKPRGIAGVARDISYRYEAEHRQRLVTHVFDNSQEGLLILDAEGRIALCNRAFEQMCGYPLAELAGRSPKFLASEWNGKGFCDRVAEELLGHGNWQGEIWLRTQSGEVRPGWFNANVVSDEQGKPLNFIVQSVDLTERKAAEARIESLSTRDQMSGLLNRQGFTDELGVWLGNGRCGTLLILDLDNLGRVNDAFGQDAGDAFLRTTGMRLRGLLRADDVLGRIGGDRFGVLTADHSDPKTAEHVARRLLDAIATPLVIDRNELVSTACAGICVFPGDGTEPAVLLRNADTAMHDAKAAGRNLLRFFREDMNQRVAEHLRLESDLRAALDRGEFLLHYQPQLDLAGDRLVGVEALLRWQHPEQGLVPPDRFIPLAEESRLILPIGRWVLTEACRQNRAWQEAGLPPAVMAVNLSAVQFHDGGIVDQVREALALSGLDPRWLELEITESVIMQEPERIAGLLGQLKALGVRISIDDFGTGYSSLAYLKRFPLDKIKIDRSFVTDLEHDPNDAAIVRLVIGIAKELELKVIAEGVETAGQLDFLRRHQCDEVQGYFLSRPVVADAIPDLVAAFAAASSR